MQASSNFGNVKIVMLKGEKGDKFEYEDYTPEELESLRGEKGDPFTYDDFTEEQLTDLRSSVASAYYRKIDATYRTIGDNTETIPIPIEGYTSADMLLIDVEGLALTEGVDYTIDESNIVLATPITHNYTAVNFRAIRAFAITTEDYDSLIGDLTTDMSVYIDEWMAEHPEATTTVQDGSVTNAKLAQTGGILSEVIDIRTGADGTNYTTAGDAVRSQITGLDNKLSALLTNTYFGPSLEDFSSAASITVNQWRCSGNISQTKGKLESVSIRAGRAGNALVAIFELSGATAKVIALFSVSCEVGLNKFVNGSDFVVDEEIPVNSFIGVSIESGSLFQPTFYTDGTSGYNLTNFVASPGAVCSVLVSTTYNIGVGMTITSNNFESTIENIGQIANGSNNPLYSEEIASLTNNQTLRITNANCAIKKNLNLAFFATISSFDFIRIGYYNQSLTTAYNRITIDNQSVIVSNVNNNNVATYNHGLTIANNIAVFIKSNYDETADIIIMSNGNVYTQTVSWFRMVSNTIPGVIAPPNTTLTNCKLTQTCEDYRAKTWAYGDSYFNCSASRWMYYADQEGFMDNMLVDAYPGENSVNALNGLNADLAKGTPKFILWALGMNDGSDGESAPQADWLSTVQTVISLCESKGIIPILATIPTVPTINNEQKNAWVRNSGYSYIDFADAVGADSNGNWYDGMLESDAISNIHPTVTGAQALFMRACVDFPQMMVK